MRIGDLVICIDQSASPYPLLGGVYRITRIFTLWGKVVLYLEEQFGEGQTVMHELGLFAPLSDLRAVAQLIARGIYIQYEPVEAKV